MLLILHSKALQNLRLQAVALSNERARGLFREFQWVLRVKSVESVLRVFGGGKEESMPGVSQDLNLVARGACSPLRKKTHENDLWLRD